MKITFGSRSFLLTGDIERETELSLTSGYELSAQVIKVAHHGSRTSSTEDFVSKVSPDIAIISVGRRSRFGHPHREIFERWHNAGARVLTTGEKGTITLITDGSVMDLRTYVP